MLWFSSCLTDSVLQLSFVSICHTHFNLAHISLFYHLYRVSNCDRNIVFRGVYNEVIDNYRKWLRVVQTLSPGGQQFCIFKILFSVSDHTVVNKCSFLFNKANEMATKFRETCFSIESCEAFNISVLCAFNWSLMWFVSFTDEGLPFISRTGKTSDMTKIKGWRNKFIRSKETSSSNCDGKVCSSCSCGIPFYHLVGLA